MTEVIRQSRESSWPPFLDGELEADFEHENILAEGIEIRPLSTVALAVHRERYDASIAFFTEIVGLSCVASKNGTAVLCPRTNQTRLELVIDNLTCTSDRCLLAGANECGFRHVAFAVEGNIVEFADSVLQKLKGSPTDVVPTITGMRVCSNGPKQLVYFRGPGGVLLELMRFDEDVDLSTQSVSGGGKLRSEYPYISSIDHANIVTGNIRETLDTFRTLGFKVIPGKYGRLQGSWIDNVTGLRNVDAFYVGLQIGGRGCAVELIEYRSPKPQGDLVGGAEASCKLKGITLVTNRLQDFALHLQRRCYHQVSSVGDSMLELSTPEGMLVIVLQE